MRELAKMVGISNPYLSQIERGLRAPSETVLESIAETLDTSADELYRMAGFVERPRSSDGHVHRTDGTPTVSEGIPSAAGHFRASLANLR
jgi:transcriptional regulator with XRE-family HTH domain